MSFLSFVSILLFSSIRVFCFEPPSEPSEEFTLELPEYRTPSPAQEPQSFFEVPCTSKTPEPLESFWDWKLSCLEAIKQKKSPLTKQQFLDEMRAYATHCKNQNNRIIQPHNWVAPSHGDAIMPSIKFFLGLSFSPYAMKLEVDPDEKTAFIGDIHGDIESFNSFLESLSDQGITDPQNPFKVTPKSYVIFLGDYTDRGEWGIEVLFALARFLRLNDQRDAPTPQVVALRGNHENLNINSSHDALNGYRAKNLYQEIQRKFPSTDNSHVFDAIEVFYNSLPLALFVKSGPHALLACHGGIEPGFVDTPLLLESPGKLNYMIIDQLYRKQIATTIESQFKPAFDILKQAGEINDFDPCAFDNPLFEYGFLWTDYDFNPDPRLHAPILYRPGRGIQFPEQITKKLFEMNSSKSCKLIGNIRGHQHSSQTMPRILNKDSKSDVSERGLAKIWVPEHEKQPIEQLWPGIVCTLCACPHNGYGKSYDYYFGAYTILETGMQLEQWKLKVHHFY